MISKFSHLIDFIHLYIWFPSQFCCFLWNVAVIIVFQVQIGRCTYIGRCSFLHVFVHVFNIVQCRFKATLKNRRPIFLQNIIFVPIVSVRNCLRNIRIETRLWYSLNYFEFFSRVDLFYIAMHILRAYFVNKLFGQLHLWFSLTLNLLEQQVWSLNVKVSRGCLHRLLDSWWCMYLLSNYWLSLRKICPVLSWIFYRSAKFQSYTIQCTSHCANGWQMLNWFCADDYFNLQYLLIQLRQLLFPQNSLEVFTF